MAKYVRLSIKGGIGPSEVWSVNPVLDPAGEIGFDFDQANFDAFTQALAAITIPVNLRALMSSAVTVRSFRAELRDTDTVGFIGASEYTLPTPIAGSGSASAPPQTAVVASLRSGSALASGRGRMYWPALAAAISNTTLRLSAGSIQTYSDNFASYLTLIANQAKASLTPVSLVNFGVSIYSPTKKTLTPVTSIRVGDVLDVQRRRRDAMPEQYATRSYPYTP